MKQSSWLNALTKSVREKPACMFTVSRRVGKLGDAAKVLYRHNLGCGI